MAFKVAVQKTQETIHGSRQDTGLAQSEFNDTLDIIGFENCRNQGSDSVSVIRSTH